MKPNVFYFLVFSQLGILQAVLAQTINLQLQPRGGSTSSVFVEIHPQFEAAKDSSSTKISAVPIIAFGLGGFILGGIIGAQIDQGGPFEITKTERTSMVMGTAVGVTFGYILAKRKQGKSTVKMQR
ncbi:MAG: hypothetical protein ACREBU_11670 [Nitrososphaera sp.]